MARKNIQKLKGMGIRKVFLVSLMLVVMFHLYGKAFAFGLSMSQPLIQTIAHSDAVLVAKLVDYTPDPTDQLPAATKTATGQLVYAGEDAFIIVNRLKPRGQYTFELLEILKGQSEKTLQAQMPSLLAYYYGDARLKVELGDKVLLLLKRAVQNQWVPTDDTLPLIPLSADLPITDFQVSVQNESTAVVESRVLSLMLSGLVNPTLRQANVYLVRNTVNPQVVVGLAPYLNDDSADIQDSVLYGLATNQQVTVIPRIAALDKKMEDYKSPMSRSAQSLETLQHFNTREALPYLNPLLFDTSRNIRINVILGLRTLADRTSIPYLLLALRDSDPQKFFAPEAARILHKLVPGSRKDQRDAAFWAHRNEDIQLVSTWWQDELSGKHPHSPDDKDRIVLNEGETHEAKELPQLNEGLFMRSQYTRLAAVAALNKLADQSSVPYLIIALRDPNGDVAYGAHHVLARLVPALGPYLERATFDASRAKLAEAGVAWWVKHLQDAEDARLPEFLRHPKTPAPK